MSRVAHAKSADFCRLRVMACSVPFGFQNWQFTRLPAQEWSKDRPESAAGDQWSRYEAGTRSTKARCRGPGVQIRFSTAWVGRVGDDLSRRIRLWAMTR